MMKSAPLRSLRRQAFWMALPILTIALSTASPADEESPIRVVRIEEDWEMELIEPAPENHSPQVTFFVNPTNNVDAQYFQIQMNYAADEIFSGGGFHVSAVLDGNFVDQARSGTRRGLTVDSDTIRWTNVMAIANGELLFAIKDGYCNDWGDFGGPEYLVRMPAPSVSDLGQYHPMRSLDEVDIGYGGNRVASIVLKNVRVYQSNGNVVTVPINQSVDR